MAKHKFATTADECIINLETGDRIEINSVKREPQNMIVINEELEGTDSYIRVRGSLIDESAYNLSDWIGEDEPAPKKSKTTAAKKPAQPAKKVSNGSIEFTREELREFHDALQATADLVRRKLLDSVV